jgi:hypothetical protein
MAAYEHGTNDSVKLSVHARAKKNALGDLKAVMDSLESPKVAGREDVSGISVTRKSSLPKSSPKASMGSAHDGVDGPEHEQSEPKEVEDLETKAEKTFSNGRADPGDVDTGHEEHELGDAAEVDAALKKFLVKGKKHIKG